MAYKSIKKSEKRRKDTDSRNPNKNSQGLKNKNSKLVSEKNKFNKKESKNKNISGIDNGKDQVQFKSDIVKISNKRKKTTLLDTACTRINRIFSLRHIYDLIFSPQYFYLAACVFIFIEAVVNIFIIENVKYTEIDWKAYMQEVEGFLNGTWDYSKLKGDTGPLVYPAGFVYVFSLLYYITNQGTNIYLAQYIFAVFYLLTLSFVFRIYSKSRKLPPYILIFVCCLSYRIHSIYVLRLFNDPIAIMLAYASINAFMSGRWTMGSILFSCAVSIKMNILLFAPALLFVYLYSLGFFKTILQLLLCLVIQIVLAIPFLVTNPLAYMRQAFDLGRVFLHQWTVNWRFIPHDIFVNKYFHISLLAAHVVILAIFFFTHWKKYLVHFEPLRKAGIDAACQHILFPLFVSNFVGIMCARSLHYQFYIWYYHSIPYLLWCTNLSTSLKLSLMGFLELCWNTFPSTWWSSSILHGVHLIILVALFAARPTSERLDGMRKKLAKKSR